MATEKHLRLTGISDVSWKDAIAKTIVEASKSIDYLTSHHIIKSQLISHLKQWMLLKLH